MTATRYSMERWKIDCAQCAIFGVFHSEDDANIAKRDHEADSKHTSCIITKLKSI
jgi:hypothetical protein